MTTNSIASIEVDGQELVAAWREITPEVARGLLERNRNPRKLNERRVAVIADDLRRGRWKPNGETIKISAASALRNGKPLLEVRRLLADVEQEEAALQRVELQLAEGSCDS